MEHSADNGENEAYLAMRRPFILGCLLVISLASFQYVWTTDSPSTPPIIRRYSRALAQSLMTSLPSRYLLSGRLYGVSLRPNHRERWVRRYRPILKEVANLYSLDPEFVEILIAVESGFRVDAISPRGAIGLMQVLPTTALDMGIANPFDPVENMHAGCRYLQHLMRIYKGDLQLVLAAYNSGPGAVDKYGGIPPYPETQSYVRKILSAYKGYSRV